MQWPKITRRRLLKGGVGAITGGAGLYGYARLIEPHWLEVTRHDMALRDLPERWVGRRLVHVTDLHLGRRVDPDYLRGSMRAVVALSPEIVAISGDLVDQERPESIRDIANLLAPVVESGPRVIASLGNHDYGWGWKRTTFAEEMAGVLRDAGVAVLRNERVEVDGLHVLGMDDLWAGRYRPEAAIAGLPSGAPAIALSHNPDTVDTPGWAGFSGWVLAGHTHGGQCKPPFLPPPVLPVENRRYTAGRFDLTGGRTMYISRGVGHVKPVRFNCRPELALFTLRRAGGGLNA